MDHRGYRNMRGGMAAEPQYDDPHVRSARRILSPLWFRNHSEKNTVAREMRNNVDTSQKSNKTRGPMKYRPLTEEKEEQPTINSATDDKKRLLSKTTGRFKKMLHSRNRLLKKQPKQQQETTESTLYPEQQHFYNQHEEIEISFDQQSQLDEEEEDIISFGSTATTSISNTSSFSGSLNSFSPSIWLAESNGHYDDDDDEQFSPPPTVERKPMMFSSPSYMQEEPQASSASHHYACRYSQKYHSQEYHNPVSPVRREKEAPVFWNDDEFMEVHVMDSVALRKQQAVHEQARKLITHHLSPQRKIDLVSYRVPPPPTDTEHVSPGRMSPPPPPTRQDAPRHKHKSSPRLNKASKKYQESLSTQSRLPCQRKNSPSPPSSTPLFTKRGQVPQRFRDGERFRTMSQRIRSHIQFGGGT